MPKKPTIGKKGRTGRFVTLGSGRVIFIPKGGRTKWADVREKVRVAARAEREMPRVSGVAEEDVALLAGKPRPEYPEVPGFSKEDLKLLVGEKPTKRAKEKWEKAGLKPGDFGAESWDDVDPEVVEDALRRAGGPKPKLGKKRKIKVGGRTYNIPEVR